MCVAVGDGMLVAVDVGINVGVDVATALPDPQADRTRTERLAMVVEIFFLIRASP